MVEAFPLYWPDGWKRTPATQRKNGRFRLGFAVARDGLMLELERMGARHVTLSSNVPLKRDGMPYATHGQPEDSGAAVYFSYKGKQLCFACDQFELVKDNLSAIKHTIEALRGIERWGASDMLERAFTGFAQLSGSTSARPWREVFEFGSSQLVSRSDIDSRFKALALQRHPDTGGTDEEMSELLNARTAALTEVRA